jgi:predicted naringenin-chalcone synthase
MRRYAAEAVPLACQVANDALHRSRILPAEITHIVTVSCTGFFAPGIDIALVKQLALPPSVGRVHVGFMGCHGVLNALRVADAFVACDPSARVLLAAVELCSLHYQYGTDPQKLVANALFADGAAALVAYRAGREDFDHGRVVAYGSCVMPDSEDGMTWRIGNHGFEMTLSPRVPELIAMYLRPWLTAWLAKSGLQMEQIGSWAVHPGGPRVLTSVAEALGLPAAAMDASAGVLAECGNMSSPTILFVLERLQQAGADRPCVALAFGPGLTAEAALIV